MSVLYLSKPLGVRGAEMMHAEFMVWWVLCRQNKDHDSLYNTGLTYSTLDNIVRKLLEKIFKWFCKSLIYILNTSLSY